MCPQNMTPHSNVTKPPTPFKLNDYITTPTEGPFLETLLPTITHIHKTHINIPKCATNICKIKFHSHTYVHRQNSHITLNDIARILRTWLNPSVTGGRIKGI